MKQLTVIIILIILVTNTLFSQTATIIKTPKGSVVSDSYIIPEMTAADIAAINQYTVTNYPNATILSDASDTYNCHGYAWYISEGGSNVWIGYTTTTAEDIFWTDGSYYEVFCQTPNSKVSYASDNHSAITTTVTDIFQSKWGNFPLLLHNKNYTPYNSSVLKYYKKPFSTSTNAICTTQDFTVNAPNGTSVSWSVSPSGIVSLQQNGTTATLTKIISGKVDLTASFTDACGTPVTLTINSILVGGDMFGHYTVNPSTTQYSIGTYRSITAQRGASIGFTFTADQSTISDLAWSWDNYTTSVNPATIYFTAPQTGYTTATKYVHLDATTGCGASRVTTTIAIMSLGWSYRVMATPNPASNTINISFLKLIDSTNISTEIQLSSAKTDTKSTKTLMTLYDINTNAFVRQWAFDEAELSDHKLNIEGVPKGVYVLKISRINESSSIKIIVQ